MTEPKRVIHAEDVARDILRTELKKLKKERDKLGPPTNWTGAIVRKLLDLKIEAFTRQILYPEPQ